jgi:hypothetical protein
MDFALEAHLSEEFHESERLFSGKLYVTVNYDFCLFVLVVVIERIVRRNLQHLSMFFEKLYERLDMLFETHGDIAGYRNIFLQPHGFTVW